MIFTLFFQTFFSDIVRKSFNPLIQVNDFYPHGHSDYWDVDEDVLIP